MLIEPGDEVVYTPNILDLPPIHKRSWDIGVCVDVGEQYIRIRFDNYEGQFLPYAITHYPLSPKIIKTYMRKVFPDIISEVEARTASQVFTIKTGQIGRKGFGPADVLRSFLAKG